MLYHYLSQFLHSYVTEYININETVIGLDLLNETIPAVSLSGYRKDNTNVLKVLKDKFPKDDTDTSDVKSNKLAVIDDGVKSNIVFIPEQDISSAGVKFSYSNGIKTATIKKRSAANVLSGKTKDGQNDTEITIVVTKGHYLSVGNVIQINLSPDFPEYNGKHRIVSKQITASSKSVNCTLQLSKERPEVSDFF